MRSTEQYSESPAAKRQKINNRKARDKSTKLSVNGKLSTSSLHYQECKLPSQVKPSTSTAKSQEQRRETKPRSHIYPSKELQYQPQGKTEQYVHYKLKGAKLTMEEMNTRHLYYHQRTNQYWFIGCTREINRNENKDRSQTRYLLKIKHCHKRVK